jgi:hypothetical protein
MAITKLELQQALNARNAELETARLRIAQLEGDVAVLQRNYASACATIEDDDSSLREAALARLVEHHAGLNNSTWANVPFEEFMELARKGFAAKQPKTDAPKRDARKVYEFDPAVPGDFKRASQAARECGGVVRRAGQ